MSLPIVFFGTAGLAAVILSALRSPSPGGTSSGSPTLPRSTSPPVLPSWNSSLPAAPWTVIAVVTQPDRPQGRSLRPEPSPVKRLALHHGLPVLQPERARDPAFLSQLASLRPALIIVAAYGQILPRALLELPHHGCLNVHTSLLPKYRGAAPIQWALLNGDPETGVTLMKMDEGLDTGGIVAVRTTPIGPDDDAISLHDRLATMGADLLIETLPGYVEGRIVPRPQPAEGSSYARKITREDGRIDWQLSAAAIWNRIRALVPWPGCYTFLAAGPRPLLLKIWQGTPAGEPGGNPGEILAANRDSIVVACGSGSLRIQSLQLEGGRRLAPAAFLAGHRLQPGDRFVDVPPVSR